MEILLLRSLWRNGLTGSFVNNYWGVHVIAMSVLNWIQMYGIKLELMMMIKLCALNTINEILEIYTVLN
jgi:hypothetical protein